MLDHPLYATSQTAPVMKGYWMFSDEAKYLTPTKVQMLKDEGITDVFVCTRDGNGNWYGNELQNAINQLHPQEIKVHAWINCFHSASGFINPATTTSTQTIKTKIYYKLWYKSYYKHYYKYYYKYKGKTVYKWRYTWKYTYNYTWKYYYKTTSKTIYGSSYQNTLISGIKNIVNNYDVDGIQLDYVRYPGTAHYYANSVQIITNFVAKVKANIGNKELSCAVMSEGSTNAYSYGQDYSQLTKYVDFLCPMTYKGNYNTNDAWITSMTAYIVTHSNGKPVYTGLTTYLSDFNLRSLSANEMQNDVNAAKRGGASGFVLFKYDYRYKGVPTWNYEGVS